jgi:hypothetical protein
MSPPAYRFTPASTARTWLRAALFGPSGAGKTYSALAIATALVPEERIALIDTEHGSASKYADRFTFDTLALQAATIEHYAAAIDAAAAAGYPLLIIDSLSHAWQELLEEVDRLTRTSRHKGNKWSAWSEGTPKQRRLVDAILGYPGHVLATMRSKTEWAIESGAGKGKPVRIGLAPEQGKGIEYEFDLLLELNPAHVAEVIKDRSGRFQDRLIERPGASFGAELAAWLAAAPAPRPAPEPSTPTDRPTNPRGVQCPNPRRTDAPSSVPSGAPQSARQPEATDSAPSARAPGDTTPGASAPAEGALISAAQHRRLEARIAALGLERERVRAWCERAFAVTHFPELTPAHYRQLDARLSRFAAATHGTAPAEAPSASPEPPEPVPVPEPMPEPVPEPEPEPEPDPPPEPPPHHPPDPHQARHAA